MATPQRLAVFGTGGHGREIAWLAEQAGVAREAIVFVVNEKHFDAPQVNGLTVHTLESSACDGWPCVIAIGDPPARMRIFSLCAARGMSAVTLVHPSVSVHETTRIGTGAVIAAGVVLTVNTSIGDHVHVNIGALVSHDVEIGEGSTLSPGVRIAGHVSIGREVFIGVGATIINGSPSRPIRLGDGAFVAAGACVTGDVASNTRVIGVPARTR